MPPADPLRRRRWLRVSIRGLMALVVVVAVAMWLFWGINSARTQRRAIEVIRAGGGSVQFDFERRADRRQRRGIAPIPEPSGPKWLRAWLGDDYFRTVVAVSVRNPLPRGGLELIGGLDGLVDLTIVDASGLEAAWPALGRLRRLERVVLRGPAVNDAALAALGRQESLRSLVLQRPRVTDRGLASLVGASRLATLIINDGSRLTDAGLAQALAEGWPALVDLRLARVREPVPLVVAALARHHPQLRRFWLAGMPIQDADLAPIGRITGLTWLYLHHTPITDAGLVPLTRLPNLRHLALNATAVTDAGMIDSIARLPRLTSLDLAETAVGNPGLVALAGLDDLAYLNISATPINTAGLAEFSSNRSEDAARTQIIDR